ncbi:hypothetical protein HYX06_01765 [Candidatus Woesearchaeota archaeon]|nr:hypothetical protein [Candidatus Woesearchaeota archaeon]
MRSKKDNHLSAKLNPSFTSSQAALEFLMTYGWAILIVITAIGVLAYFGVLSPDNFLPEKCSLPSGMTCLDYRVESYRVLLVLQNSLGKTITVNNITVSGNNQGCTDNESITLKLNEKAVFAVTQCSNGISGQKFKGNMSVSYTIEGELSHDIKGTLKAKIVPGDSISSSSICQNAQNSGLCGGLDIVFGYGYQEACCGEYGLCCS